MTKPRKTTHQRRTAAKELGLVAVLAGYVTPEQAETIRQWQADADRMIEDNNAQWGR